MSGLFVAIGDSFTEGVGDPNLRDPNQVRGGADRLAAAEQAAVERRLRAWGEVLDRV